MDDPGSARTRSSDRGNPGTEGPEAEGVSFSRLPEVGTPCGHVYAVRRRPPVTCVVLGVFEVRVRRAESRGRTRENRKPMDPRVGASRTPPRTSMPARSSDLTDHSDGNRGPRTIHMETETNGPFRWIPRTRMSKNDCKVVRILPYPTSTTTYTVNHFPIPQHSAFPHSHRLAPPNPSITVPGPPSVPLGYPGPHPPPSSHGVRVCG